MKKAPGYIKAPFWRQCDWPCCHTTFCIHIIPFFTDSLQALYHELKADFIFRSMVYVTIKQKPWHSHLILIVSAIKAEM